MDPALLEILSGGITAHRGGDHAAAEAAYRAVLAAQPDQPDALHYLGMLAWQRGDPEAAHALVARARALAPRDAALAANLGLVLQALGRGAEAAGAYQQALALEPNHPEAWYNLGLLRMEQNRFQEAAECHGRALALAPGHRQASRQRGLALLRARDWPAAIQALHAAAQQAPEAADLLLDLSRAHEGQGELETAAALCREAARRDAALGARALARLSLLLRRLGRPAAALIHARAACWAHANEPDAQRALGQALKELGRLREAAGAFDRAHLALRTPGGAHASRPTFLRTTRAKLRHDAEQFRYLAERGAGEEFVHRAVDCEAMLAALPAVADGAVVPLPRRAGADAWYNRATHLASAPRLPAGALSPDLDAAAIEADYRRRAPGITWVDGLLTPEALQGLRRYCLESTVWYDFDHVNGYVGAYLQDGFAAPLLLQIAEELPARLPGIFGRRPLLQLWAYKYDSRLPGIDMHADFAAVNVNFWITPDDANLDPDSGGLRLWDREAPAGWTSDEYNTYDPVAQTRIRRYLEDSGASEIRVPYRQNRCVIFNSDLFHQTDDIRFRPGYANRRINITMLYGWREHG